ncbi:MAG: hypothetical protein RR413_11020 [Christensenellaceae bacterium]
MILTHGFLQQSKLHTLYESASDVRKRIINENHQAYMKKADLMFSFPIVHWIKMKYLP